MAKKTTTGTTGGKKPAARKAAPRSRKAAASETLPLDLPPPEPAPPPETAREEIETVPVEAQPLPDSLGLTHTSSPVDLPEPAVPLPHDGLKWTTTVMAVTAAVPARLQRRLAARLGLGADPDRHQRQGRER